jgi:hypothetical protein
MVVGRYQALREAARVETASQIEIHQLDNSLIDQTSMPMLTNSLDPPNNFVAATGNSVLNGSSSTESTPESFIMKQKSKKMIQELDDAMFERK